MATVLGDREAAVTRELTKKFEEVVTGRLGELAIRYAASQPKGEIVLVVGPPAEAPPPSADDLDALLLDRLATLSAKDAAAAVAESLNLPGNPDPERALPLKEEKKFTTATRRATRDP